MEVQMPIKYTPEQSLAAFWAKVDPCRTDGCMIWLGALTKKGYGELRREGRTIQAHRFLVGKPSDGLEWDHLCHVRNCVAPNHLDAVTHITNLLRRRIRIALYCSIGHEMTEANTYIRTP